MSEQIRLPQLRLPLLGGLMLGLVALLAAGGMWVANSAATDRAIAQVARAAAISSARPPPAGVPVAGTAPAAGEATEPPLVVTGDAEAEASTAPAAAAQDTVVAALVSAGARNAAGAGVVTGALAQAPAATGTPDASAAVAAAEPPRTALAAAKPAVRRLSAGTNGGKALAAKKVTQKSTRKAAQKGARKATQISTQKATQKGALKVTQKATQKVTRKSAQKATHKVAQKVTPNGAKRSAAASTPVKAVRSKAQADRCKSLSKSAAAKCRARLL